MIDVDYRYSYVPETKEQLDWAELVTIDLSKYDDESTRMSLANELLAAINTKGFFYLINFGISQAEVDRQFGIGGAFYTSPLEERMRARSKVEQGNSNGYRPMGLRMVGVGGLRDRTEEYNTPIHDDPNIQHPPVIQKALSEIKRFEHRLHEEVLKKIYDLIALALEVPPDNLTEIHEWRTGACGILRYMRYSPFSDEEIPRLYNGLYAGGHTDSSAITLLFRQVVAGLQIRDPQSEQWKYVKPMTNALTVNAGDCLSFLTGGYLKSTIHRVAVPPLDQRSHERLGVIYFSRPPPSMLLRTIPSRVLSQAGCSQNGFEQAGQIPTAGEFQHHKELWQQRMKTSDKILPGFEAKRYA